MFVYVHSIDSEKDIIINTRFIVEIEPTLYGSNIWTATDAGVMRMIRTTMNSNSWVAILGVK